MILRRYTPADCEQILKLFYETVHTVNARDYSPAQLDVWATGKEDAAKLRCIRLHNAINMELLARANRGKRG